MSSEMSPLLRKANSIVEAYWTHMIEGGRAKDGLLEYRILDALKEIEKQTWQKAAFEVDKCAARLKRDVNAPEGFYGAYDLMGLAEDFYANANGLRVSDADR